MSRMIVMAVAVLLVTSGAAWAADGPTTAPSQASVNQTEVYAKWACYLAGLALAVGLWVGWSLRTIARNQVDLARLIVNK